MPAELFAEKGMKHPSPQVESFVFNLGNASKLRCSNNNKTTCGNCEGCSLTKQITLVKSWLPRAGDQSKKRFILGLIRRLHSVDLVRHVSALLEPLLCKDYVYARSRSKPSLKTDTATMSSDHSLDVVELEKNISEIWNWFQNANYWTKSNFLTQILQDCDSHLLYLVGVQARTLVASEMKAFHPCDDYELESVADTVHSYQTEKYSDLELLKTACTEYSVPQRDPFSEHEEVEEDEYNNVNTNPDEIFDTRTNTNLDDMIINDDSGDEDSIFGEIDPTCFVVAGSAKAHAGVAMYKDFIRFLPVHLSKTILGMLDQATLNNCVCVSKNWRAVAEEVHQEYFINQHLQEEVMLMQGASAQGCNPIYAKDIDVAVPNLYSGTCEAVRTDEGEIETQFKTEINFETAYSGYATRKIIMEERNVYCGAYNVMVLIDESDSSRVVHTDGGRLITLGSTDRRVILVDTQTGHQVEPSMTGHAGSIRCLALDEKRGFVISGSYDTSIRQWSLETGKPMKIYRGHTDTVLCLEICGNYLVSGGKDNTCRVWELGQKKAIRTFKHKHAVTAVAMSLNLVISGCEAGKVKVWDFKTGKLIKMLTGHHGQVTAIKFDRWHIVTSSKDGYALVWSSQGNHKRCLAALRHPKDVLSLAFMYLRIITGSADGKLRIWNMVTGQCLRIMRGNSRSDPIIQLIAIGNRISINTSRNLLVLNFEPVQYDYTLENSKMPPLVQYSKYSDAPVRQQPYSYIRANRMKVAGATNAKIIYHGGMQAPEVYYNNQKRAEQIPHSAKSLSRTNMNMAKRIQSAASGRTEFSTLYSAQTVGDKKEMSEDDTESRYKDTVSEFRSVIAPSIKSTARSKPPVAPSRITTAKSRMGLSTTRSGTQSVVSVTGFQIGGRGADDDSSVLSEEPEDQRRRVSWAFERGLMPPSSTMGLNDTKALLRSQIRAKSDDVPPDFVYLTINTIHANMKPTEASKNMETNRRDFELNLTRKFGRPASSPSKIDPRTKVPVEDLEWENFCIEHGVQPPQGDAKSEAASHVSHSTRTGSARSKKVTVEEEIVVEPPSTKIVTEFAEVPVDTKPHMSLYNKRVKSSIPKARLLRPHTAKVYRSNKPGVKTLDARPKSAAVTTRTGMFSRIGSASRPGTESRATISISRPGTSKTNVSAGSSGSTDINNQRIKKGHGFKTSSTEHSFVPMLMYSPDVKNRIAELREERIQRQGCTTISLLDDEGVQGNVSQFNDPMRNHVEFKLLTHEQTLQHIASVKGSYKDNRNKKQTLEEKKQRAAWLARVKGQLDTTYTKKPNSLAPEIREYGEAQSVI